MEQIFLCRHGETEWALTGQHTGKTDIALTEKGQRQALILRKELARVKFAHVLTSPRKRAIDTCEGMGAIVEPLAAEWDYGDYEGLKTAEIRQKNPSWNLFADGCPHGESPKQVVERADRLLKKCHAMEGTVAIFSHGHFLRVLATRYLGWEIEKAKHLMLSVASISILGYERQIPAISLWNYCPIGQIG